MSPESQAVFDAALALPQKEREMLVDQLLDTLSFGAGDLSEEAFIAELARQTHD